MAQNLKERLKRIRDTGNKKTHEDEKPRQEVFDLSGWPGWENSGYLTLKRSVSRELSFSLPDTFSKALAILVPDFLRQGKIPATEELLFFDFETTGLSGGAGTVIFLAAFGRFVYPSKIEISQYLLLDYPGEPDFIERVLSELTSPLPIPQSPVPVLVSYNGKSFDSQILNNRCLLNGIKPPVLLHADLLHPARRLWKRLLPDCSQSTVEVSILGLDRTGDISGALAPEIWFSFLRGEKNREDLIQALFAVCYHNIRDILGLSSIFLALTEIAARPLETHKFRIDEEALAFSYKTALKKFPFFFKGDDSHAKTGKTLLETAARNGHPRAALTHFRSLAIDAEWRLKDPVLALRYTESALALKDLSQSIRDELEKRRRRLNGKLHNRLTGSTSTSR